MKFLYLTLIIILALSGGLAQSAAPSIIELRCEYLVDPIGIDMPNPRFSWKLLDNRYGAYQSAYRLKIYEIEGEEKRLVWNSRRQNTARPASRYEGPPLKSFSQYEWELEVWDLYKSKYETKVAYFETAFMPNEPWPGQWITDYKTTEDRPSTLFRKEISIDKPIDRARLYISSGGIHHVTLNGKPISDEVLNPVFTRFDKRLLYNTYNLDSLLEVNANTLGVELGNGFFNHQTPVEWSLESAPWRKRPLFKALLRITHTDGSITSFTTDTSWKIHDSPRTFNSLYLSENYDATQEIIDWNLNGFDDSEWLNAKAIAFNPEQIESQLLPPIRITQEFDAIEFTKASDRRYIYKFPINMAGITRLTGVAGTETTLTIKHSEQLINDQNAINTHFSKKITRETEGEVFHSDIVKVKPGPFSFQPVFNYKGFQYVEILSNQPISLNQGSLKALRIHSDMNQIGEFSSDFEQTNKIWEATNNSYLSNMVGYPTDCPQREKNGWTGDAHFISEAGLYNFDAILLYEKWMKDHRDAQLNNGKLPNIIPSPGWGYDGATFDWTASMILIPWDVYMMKGDPSILEDNYNSMKRFLDYWNQDYSLKFGIGDWQNFESQASNQFTSLAYYAHVLELMSKISLILNKPKDSRDYLTASANVKKELNKNFFKANVKKELNKNFFNKSTKTYGNGTITEQSMAIEMGITSQENYDAIASYLKQKLEQIDYTTDFGLMGSKFTLDALITLKLNEEALRLAKQKQYPSWGHFIEMGLTTMPEDWNYQGIYHAASLNHAYLGHINAWFYKTLGGVSPTEEGPGFRQFKIAPVFDEQMGTVEMSHNSPYGQIETQTSVLSNSSYQYDITIPPGSEGLLYIPEGFGIVDYLGAPIASENFPIENENGVLMLTSGEHSFSFSNTNQALVEFPRAQAESESYGRVVNEEGLLFFEPNDFRPLEVTITVFNNGGSIIYKNDKIPINTSDRTFLFDIGNELEKLNAVTVIVNVKYSNLQRKSFTKRYLKLE